MNQAANTDHRKTWKIFFDLQCPYSKIAWGKVHDLRKAFPEYHITTHMTSLAFHPQAFVAQSGAYLIGANLGAEARKRFEDACFRNQDKFTNAAVGDARKSDVDKIFGDIAEEAGIFDDGSFTRESFLSDLHNWTEVVKPTWAEHKEALNYGVFGAPKHVINEKLVANTESAWGAAEWKEALAKLQ